jgi:ABC-type transporter Mla MlaB component
MLRITTDRKRASIKLSVEGRLAGPWVGTLEECWRDLRSASPRSKLQIHLCGVSHIDNAGKLLLAEIHRQGGQLVAEGCLNQAVIEEIVEAADAGKHARRREARPKSGPIIFWLFLASLLAPALGACAQEKPAAVTIGAQGECFHTDRS